MAIMNPSEVANMTSKIRILIAGFPGIGKSTLGLSAPNPLHIDVDCGLTRVEAQFRKPFIRPESYASLLDDLKPENLGDFETLVFDTGGKLLDLMKPWAIKKNPKNGQSDGTLSLKGYGAVGREFQRLMDYCFYELHKNIVMLFPAKEDKDGDNVKLRILVEGQTKDNVWQPMELGGFVEMSGNRRVIGFSNCERYFAKGTHGVYGIREIPDTHNHPNDFLTRLFEEVNQNIVSEAAVFEQERIAYEEVMKEYGEKIGAIGDVDGLNAIAPEMKGIVHHLTSQRELKALFRAKYQELGAVYNKEAGIYVISDNGLSA